MDSMQYIFMIAVLEVHALRQDIKTLLEMANKSKGGFFVGMAIASVVGGIISFIATKLVR